MSDEQSNQPRKVKDLKARLGRTIAPSTPGAVMPPGINLPSPVAGLPTPPGAAPAGGDGAAATPAAPGAGGAVPPPAGIPAPALPPPPGGVSAGLGAPLPGPKAVVEPPWVKQQREEDEKRRVEDEKRKKRAAADPFATAEAPTGPQAMRIVALDDSAVGEGETGTKGRNAILAGVVVVVAFIALFIGKSLGGTFARNANINRGIADANALYGEVQRGDTALQAVKTEVDKLVAAANPANGTPHVDFAAVQAAVAVQNPFPAARFATTNYSLFDAPALEALLTYHEATHALFTRLERFATSYNIRGSNQQGRDALNASFTAYNNFQSFPPACVPTLAGEGPQAQWSCNMVFIDVAHAGPEGIPSRTRPQAQPTNRAIFRGQAIDAAASDKILIPVNLQGSADVMGSTLHLHDRFVRDLAELKGLMDEALEARANFRNEMDRIRHLPNQFTF